MNNDYTTLKEEYRARMIASLVFSLVGIMWGSGQIYVGCVYVDEGDMLAPYSMALLITGFVFISIGLLGLSAVSYHVSLMTSTGREALNKHT